MQVDWRVVLVVPIIGANKIGIHRPSIEIYESQQGQGGPSIYFVNSSPKCIPPKDTTSLVINQEKMSKILDP
jgi:hypothetical protein